MKIVFCFNCSFFLMGCIFYLIIGMEFNFYKYSRGKIDLFGILYDYGSLMYYRSIVFSRNGKFIIVVKKLGVCYLG